MSSSERDRIISIDPGAGTTGYAVWYGPDWSELVAPMFVGILTGRSKADWEERCHYTVVEFQELMLKLMRDEGCDIVRVYIEMPQHMEGAKARMSANEGSIVKLCLLAGRLWQAVDQHNIGFEWVPVRTWKGQLTKEAVTSRVERKLSLPRGSITSHAMDATGIGLWAKGHFG
jgi:Holliday junction resolvasome RuvABC endonuclease subunit